MVTSVIRTVILWREDNQLDFNIFGEVKYVLYDFTCCTGVVRFGGVANSARRVVLWRHRSESNFDGGEVD